MKQSNSGFTVLELIIVIVAIAILATMAIIGYGQIAPAARDANRRADVDLAAKSLQTYVVKHKHLPIGSGNSSMISTHGSTKCNTINVGSETDVVSRLNSFSGCSIWNAEPSSYPAYLSGKIIQADTGSSAVWQAMTQQNVNIKRLEHPTANRTDYCKRKGSGGSCLQTDTWLAGGEYSLVLTNAYVASASSNIEVCMRIMFVPERLEYKAPDASGNIWYKPYAKFVCTAGYPNPPADIIY
ncbi:hypothetical protein CR969_01135 [Candidatus Saccharibacteria bacterium]|nr:MAG: hypothetical protein CR969_01135 [Candidatus Saccharibacteria bacterium]